MKARNQRYMEGVDMGRRVGFKEEQGVAGEVLDCGHEFVLSCLSFFSCMLGLIPALSSLPLQDFCDSSHVYFKDSSLVFNHEIIKNIDLGKKKM